MIFEYTIHTGLPHDMDELRAESGLNFIPLSLGCHIRESLYTKLARGTPPFF